MLRKAYKSGNALILSIPKAEVTLQGIKAGDLVEITVKKVDKTVASKNQEEYERILKEEGIKRAEEN